MVTDFIFGRFVPRTWMVHAAPLVLTLWVKVFCRVQSSSHRQVTSRGVLARAAAPPQVTVTSFRPTASQGRA